MTKYLTKEALDGLKKELDYLENVKKKEIAERIKYAASFGDLRENSAYEEAKEAQGFLQGKILELKEIIAKAQVLEKKENGKAELGAVVEVECGGEKEKFRIMEPEEADILNGKISYQSPLGEALMGKVKGEKVRVKTPSGETEYQILNIE